MGNHKPYIDEGQTIQWQKEKSTKGQTLICKLMKEMTICF